MVNCSFCGSEIRRDRYNLFLDWERQDSVPSGNLQKGILHYREGVCPKCFDIVDKMFRLIVDKLRANKGKLVE